MLSWRGGAFAAALLCSVAGCHLSGGAPPVPGGQYNADAAVFQECDSVCIRPADCALAYNDDGICPPGFLCTRRFTCGSGTD